MQELINVSAVPAKLAVNFDELKKHLEHELERYAVVVTLDTVADAKKLATELNKTAGVIDARRKDEVAKVSGPIKAFDAQMKELVELCKGGRQKILDQVKRFEDETRAVLGELLHKRRAELWAELAVDGEFQRAETEDLILLTAITVKGNLAASAASKLEARVRDDKALQDRTKMRLLELENQSYRSGLAAPLSRDHVEPFLFADDARYTSELNRILDAEKRREQEAEARMRERLEREARQKAEQERLDAERERIRAEERERAEREAQENVGRGAGRSEMGTARGAQSVMRVQTWAEEAPSVQPPAPPFGDEAPFEDEEPFGDEAAQAPGASAWMVTATFKVIAPRGAGQREIGSELRRVLEAAGVSTLVSVSAVRKQESNAA